LPSSPTRRSPDLLLIPEIPYDIRSVARKIQDRERAGRPFSIVVVAEGAVPRGGNRSVIERRLGAMERLGGIGAKVAAQVCELTGKDTRHVVLGHLLRGGAPT